MKINCKWFRIYCILLIQFILSVSVSNSASAEIINIQATGVYTMSIYETPVIAQERALKEAERRAIEQAGIYIESYTKTKNAVVQKDEILAITSNLINVIEKKLIKKIDSANNLQFVANIVATVDTDSILQGLKRTDIQNVLKDYNDLQNRYLEQEKEIAKLKQAISDKTKENETLLKEKVKALESDFLLSKKFEEANRLAYNRDFDSAIKLYTEAINIYTKLIFSDDNEMISGVFTNRGYAYMNMNNYNAALSDYNKAISLNPNNNVAYNNRSVVYNNMQKYLEAVADCNKALKIDPSHAEAYINRGVSYMKLGNYTAAMQDFNKSISLTESAVSYANRGLAYCMSMNFEEGIKDLTKAIEIDPNYANSYISLGGIYLFREQYSLALKYLDKGIKLNPDFATGYMFRAQVYKELGKDDLAKKDSEKAASLGIAPDFPNGN